MEVKVLNSIRFASLSANYELDTNVNLKATNRSSYHGFNLTLDECLSAVKDTSINNYSSFYLSNDYDYKDILTLDQLPIPENYTFTSYIKLNNSADIFYLAVSDENKSGKSSLNLSTKLDKNTFFEINFIDEKNCKIIHKQNDTTKYLSYDYLTSNLYMLTGSGEIEPADINTFQYVYDKTSESITFTKKIFDAQHILTYDSSSLLKMEPSSDRNRINPYKPQQIFLLRSNPSTLNDLLSTSNYVYKKTLDTRT